MYTQAKVKSKEFINEGTWQSKPDEVAKAVEFAIKEAGYRLARRSTKARIQTPMSSTP
jgi:hypothetical protein